MKHLKKLKLLLIFAFLSKSIFDRFHIHQLLHPKVGLLIIKLQRHPIQISRTPQFDD